MKTSRDPKHQPYVDEAKVKPTAHLLPIAISRVLATTRSLVHLRLRCRRDKGLICGHPPTRLRHPALDSAVPSKPHYLAISAQTLTPTIKQRAHTRVYCSCNLKSRCILLRIFQILENEAGRKMTMPRFMASASTVVS